MTKINENKELPGMNGKCYECSKWPSGEPPYCPRKWNNKSNVMGSHNCYAYMLNDLFPVARKYHKPQPGWFYKLKTKNNRYNGIDRLSCSKTIEGVKKDNPDHLKVLSIKKGHNIRPPPYHYKGILVVSPNQDYHFARQDNRMLKVYDMILRHKLYTLSDNQFIKKVVEYCNIFMPEISQYLPKQCDTPIKKLRFLYKNSKTWSHKPGSTAITDKDADGKLIFDPLKANWDFSNKGGINYSQKCCFFIIPMNTHKDTYSTGIPNIAMFGSVPTLKARTNISANVRQQQIDRKLRQLIKK